MREDAVQMNVLVSAETAERFDQMARDLGYENRAPLIRKLIRQALVQHALEQAALRPAQQPAEQQIQS